MNAFRGKVSVETAGERAVLAEGQLLALPSLLAHNAEALEDAVLLLTISKT